jgi:hypothetical protein
LTHFSLRIAGVGDTRLKPIYAGNRYDARIQNHMKEDKLQRLFELAIWTLLFVLTCYRAAGAFAAGLP